MQEPAGLSTRQHAEALEALIKAHDLAQDEGRRSAFEATISYLRANLHDATVIDELLAHALAIITKQWHDAHVSPPRIAIVWSPSALPSDEYRHLIQLLSSIVRSSGGVAVTPVATYVVESTAAPKER